MPEIDRDIPIERHDEVDSTSRLARRKIQAGAIGEGPILLIADRQTGGVGRFGRAWASPAGGLWCTLVWPVRRDLPRVLDGLGLRLAWASARVIDHALGAPGRDSRVQIKWPNDVLLNGKKVLGVLTETLRHEGRPFLLVGVGVNADFAVSALPPALRDRATTLRDVLGRAPDRRRLIDDVRAGMGAAILGQSADEATLREIRDRLFGVGESTTVTLSRGDTKTGALVGLDALGAPILRTRDGVWTAPPGAELLHDW